MIAFLNRPTGFALAVNIVLAIALAGLVNALVASGGWSGPTHLTEPPGFHWVEQIVGFVWIGLFAFMAAARWLLLRSGDPRAEFHASLVAALIVFCASYPLYTAGMKLLPGLIGNCVTVFLAGWIACRIWPSSRVASVFVAFVLVWLTIATVYVWQLVQLNS